MNYVVEVWEGHYLLLIFCISTYQDKNPSSLVHLHLSLLPYSTPINKRDIKKKLQVVM